MSGRTEKDYDSATPALQQQMNLARRACWISCTRTAPTPSSVSNSNSSSSSHTSYRSAAIKTQLLERTACQAAYRMVRNQSVHRLAAPPPIAPPSEQPSATTKMCKYSDSGSWQRQLLLLLCGICLLLGGIEARPNMSASSSSSSSSTTSTSSSSTVKPAEAITQLNVSVNI